MRPFRNRREAGVELARALSDYAQKDVVVLGLLRGGIPVAFEVARALTARLDVFVVRKLGVPGHEELALGAMASGGSIVLNSHIVEALHIDARLIDALVRRETEELARREETYRDGRPAPRVDGRTAILVDDGLATGATMHAAARALRQRDPARIVVAVPVGARKPCASLHVVADDVVCLHAPRPFRAVGLWYEDFAQTTDEEVRALLAQARARESASDLLLP